jgi:hypothetical protein
MKIHPVGDVQKQAYRQMAGWINIIKLTPVLHNYVKVHKNIQFSAENEDFKKNYAHKRKSVNVHNEIL